MNKLTSLEDLDRLRETERHARQIAAVTGTRIFVGMGTCGIAAGANETLSAITAELDRRGIDADVSIVGCIGICVKEPLVDIQQAGGSRVTYANVRPEMVPRLIEQHLIRGQPVREWVFGRFSPEG